MKGQWLQELVEFCRRTSLPTLPCGLGHQGQGRRKQKAAAAGDGRLQQNKKNRSQPSLKEQEQLVKLGHGQTHFASKGIFTRCSVGLDVAHVVQIQYSRRKKANSEPGEQHQPIPCLGLKKVRTRHANRSKEYNDKEVTESAVAIGRTPHGIAARAADGSYAEHQVA